MWTKRPGGEHRLRGLGIGILALPAGVPVSQGWRESSIQRANRYLVPNTCRGPVGVCSLVWPAQAVLLPPPPRPPPAQHHSHSPRCPFLPLPLPLPLPQEVPCHGSLSSLPLAISVLAPQQLAHHRRLCPLQRAFTCIFLLGNPLTYCRFVSRTELIRFVQGTKRDPERKGRC